MVKKYNRTQRVSQKIQKEIAIIIQHKLKDPRIGMATVSGIEVSRTLAYAKVFITFLNNNTSDQGTTSIQVLQNAAGFIRSLLGKVIRLRFIPELTFAYDNSLVEGILMSNLAIQVVQNDRLRLITGQADETDSKDNQD